MHQALCISELLQNIFSHEFTPPSSTSHVNSHKADLAALARTCKAFKEPALDQLWGELDNLVPLARCLPAACCLSDHRRPAVFDKWFGELRFYTFTRPPDKAEQNTLRGYARRVRFIHIPKGAIRLEEGAIRIIFNLAPSTLPLFPNLRSLYWRYATVFPLPHTAAPLLTSLCIEIGLPVPVEFLDAFGDRCPHIREFIVMGSRDTTGVSRQICRWKNLHRLVCVHAALDADAISHLASIPNLKELSFTVDIFLIQPLTHTLVFVRLTQLAIMSGPLDTASFLLSHVQLPALELLDVTISSCLSRQAMWAYWAAAQEACPAIVSIRLHLTALPFDDEDVYPLLTFEDLYPCTVFSNLRVLNVSLDWHVSLSDADLLQLTTPRTDTIAINSALGWGIGMECGGITLTGLVQLLQQRPSLKRLSVAIDTSTFTVIPEGLDVSYPPREGLKFNFLDSFILPEFVPGMVSVFSALGIDPSMLEVWEVKSVGKWQALPVWERVQDELTRALTSKV